VRQLLARPTLWRRFHAGMAFVWALNIPVAVATSIKESLPYLIFVSLMTAFSGEMAALHGAQIQVKQEEGASA